MSSFWHSVMTWKISLGTLGLIGLAIYQFSQADYNHAVATLAAALGIAGAGIKAVANTNDLKGQ